MERHRAGGVLLARTHAEWRDALEHLLDDERRLALGQTARAYVDDCGSAKVAADALMTWLRPGRPG